MPRPRRLSRIVAPVFLLAALHTELAAQSVVIEGPPERSLTTATPRFSVRALGISPLARPLRFTVYITRNSTGDSPYTDTTTVTSSDSIATLLVTKLLPSGALVYWKARVTLPNGDIVESPISNPQQAPRWLTLISPGPTGGQFDNRRLPFVWSSAKVDPSFGRWTYDLQIFNNDLPEVATSGLTDTVFVPPNELYANARYTWQVHAMLAHGESVTEKHSTAFFINDPSLPTTTLLYQNFPNPFPSPTAFATCFWFDVGVGGSRISLDVVDLRGNLVRRIIPDVLLAAGTYGRGPSGMGNNCDNRYVWDGTATDGRTVPPGVYLLRFVAAGRSPSFKKILFLGR